MRKKSKGLVALVLTLVMAVSVLPMAALADYDDTADSWAATAIDRWSELGILQGDDGHFNPTGSMTRAAAASMIARLLKLTETGDVSAFTDMEDGAWYTTSGDIAKCVAAGIMKGTSETTMSPEKELQRDELFVMIARALGIKEAATANKAFGDSASVADWASGYINALVNIGAIKGSSDGNINPASLIDRASSAGLLDQLIKVYANESGATVAIPEEGVVLIVAEDVTLTGTATDYPIVLAGESKSVDMSGVTGAATVTVVTDDVTITGAPAGTEISAEGTEGVTANGTDVSETTNQDIIIPDTSTSQGGGSAPSVPSAPSVDDSVNAAAIDAIIEAGRLAVNDKMIDTETSSPYAEIPKFDTSKTPREVSVVIYDGDTPVGKVKTDILDILVKALQDNTDTVTSISIVKCLGDKDVAEGAENTTLLLNEADSTAVTNFVLAIVGDYNGSSKIGSLINQSFTVAVSDEGKDDRTTTVQYKVTFVAPELDDVIDARISSLNAAMSYASLSWDGTSHTLTVNIIDGETPVGTVYDDIAKMLCDAFNATKTTLKSVEDALNVEATKATIKLNEALTQDALKTFVLGLYIKENGKDEAEPLNDVLQSTISVLINHSFVINVTAAEEGATAEPYTITFTGETPSLDSVIGAEIDAIDAKMSYVNLDWNGGSHTLKVSITEGKTLIGTVYNDIGTMLANAFNKAIGNVGSVTDALNPDTSKAATLTIGTGIENTTLAAFIPQLYFKTGTESKMLSDYLAGASSQGMKAKEISVLDGGQFEINVTDKGTEPSTVKYTISFTLSN